VRDCHSSLHRRHHNRHRHRHRHRHCHHHCHRHCHHHKGLDWDAIYACKVPSPYKAKVTGPGDVSNFDKYAEKAVEWLGDGKDGFDDMFVGF
jgi:hypothetical protein